MSKTIKQLLVCHIDTRADKSDTYLTLIGALVIEQEERDERKLLNDSSQFSEGVKGTVRSGTRSANPYARVALDQTDLQGVSIVWQRGRGHQLESLWSYFCRTRVPPFLSVASLIASFLSATRLVARLHRSLSSKPPGPFQANRVATTSDCSSKAICSFPEPFRSLFCNLSESACKGIKPRQEEELLACLLLKIILWQWIMFCW